MELRQGPRSYSRAIPKMPKHKEKKLPSQIGGKEKSVLVYFEGQDAEGIPDHYVTRERAEELKSAGDARPIHRGKAILMKRARTFQRNYQESDSQVFTLVVAGQTPKVYSPRVQFPGFPRIEFR